MVYATIREHNSFYTPQGPELGATFSTQQEPIKKALYPLKGEKTNIANKGFVLLHTTLKQCTARKEINKSRHDWL